MKLNNAQKRRIKRAVRLAEWSYRQKAAITSNENKTPDNGLRAIIWRG